MSVLLSWADGSNASYSAPLDGARYSAWGGGMGLWLSQVLARVHEAHKSVSSPVCCRRTGLQTLNHMDRVVTGLISCEPLCCISWERQKDGV